MDRDECDRLIDFLHKIEYIDIALLLFRPQGCSVPEFVQREWAHGSLTLDSSGFGRKTAYVPLAKQSHESFVDIGIEWIECVVSR